MFVMLDGQFVMLVGDENKVRSAHMAPENVSEVCTLRMDVVFPFQLTGPLGR